MRPPLPTGTILQNRYRLLSVLGQGGFGRTYLAEDQGRFNERCALKELIPAQGGEYALDKSKELFQREAQILYQIQHPQIPQFRATFEEDQRLFLVQDYVEGQTYRMLLDQRKAQGQAFSEAEVLQLMRQLLPVLAHIHSKGIIHRDITPDNIILRQQDQLPVLIDFGVVKEIATRLQSTMTVPQSTTVGKPGYAPSEQMQTGRAYPSSDLYSLAVTAVVLLTGKEPQELFDDNTLTWYWQRWVTVSPGFAAVLNKMLNYRPGDRYQTVSEVVQALQGGATVAPQTQAPPGQGTVLTNPDVSHMQTMAVGRRPESAETPTQVNRPAPTIPEARSSIWDDPLAIIAVGFALVLVTGIGSWAIVRTVMNNNASPSPTTPPTVTSSPSPSPTLSATPTPTPSTQPVTFSQRLEVAPDSRVVKSGSLKANETLTYIVPGQQGQQLSASLNSEGVLMTVLGPDQQPINDQATRVSLWQGTLPFNGDYYLQLSPVKGLDRSNFQLTLNLQSASEPTPTPTPTTTAPSPSPSPEIDAQVVQFPPGSTGTTLSGQTTPQVIKRYLVTARRGQIISTRVNGSATLTIRYPNGQPVEDASKVLSWESELPRSGTYQIDVVAFQETSYQLDINIRDLQPPQGPG